MFSPASFIALFTGILFGMGLTIAEMVNPEKVLGFLDISGQWDPSLILVMFGGGCVSVAGFYWQKRRQSTFFGGPFHLPENTHITRQLIVGAILFGIGWGLVGLCPGPDIASVWTASPTLLWFLLPMLLGLWGGKKINHRLSS